MIDIERLDKFPQKLGMRFKEGKNKHWIRAEYRRNKAHVWGGVKRVLRSLVGKDWEEVYSALGRVCNRYKTYSSKRSVIESYVEFPRQNIYGQWISGSYHIEHFNTFEDWLEYHSRYPYKYFYYVCPFTNKLLARNPEKTKPVFIQSTDYKTELRHKVTGHKKDDFEEVWSYKEVEYKSRYSRYRRHLSHIVSRKQLVSSKLLYYEYGIKRLHQKAKWERYIAKESDFVSIVVSGWIKYFDSKSDPEFQRYHAEKRQKAQSAFYSEVEKERLTKEMAFLSLTGHPTKRERTKADRAKQREEEKKAKEETKQVLERKGFRPDAFVNNK